MAVARVTFKIRIQAYWHIRPELISDFGIMKRLGVHHLDGFLRKCEYRFRSPAH